MKKNRYKDLEDLLYIGFIPYQARIGDINFVFKSVSDLEYRKTNLMSGLKEDPRYNTLFHYNYLYHSIYMVNGVSIIEKRDLMYPELMDIFKDYHPSLLKSIFSILDRLTSRLDKCVNLVEPYSYEDASRYAWVSKNKTVLNSFLQTGIRGTEGLGLNQFQKYWNVLNFREDDKDSFEEKYSLAKFIASFTDPKSVKKIEASDKAKKEEESGKRERVKKYGTEEEKNRNYDPTATRDGIISELEKQMRGDKDHHDQVIEAYEKNIRKGMLQQMQELKNMKDSRDQNLGVMEEARPISREEMMERINKTKNSPKMYMKAIDSGESKYMEMSNVKTEDVLDDSGLTTEGYNGLVRDEMFKSVHKEIEEEEGVVSNYLTEQKRLASQAGLDDEESNFDFPNLRNK